MFISVLVAVLSLPATSLAQAQPGQTDLPITPLKRAEVIEAILRRLNESYVSPEAAARMESAISARVKRRGYDQIISSAALAQALTSHLREVSNDRHLGIRFSYEPIPANAGRNEPSPEERERFRRSASSINFGFEAVKRLNGNVGYMELNGFIRPELGAETAIAAMQFIANTDALIIDLRYNGGGEPGLAQLISSYFFSGSPVHLHSVYWREDNRIQQYWTLPYVPGRRYVDKPVYVLTSRRTFSAPESFAYSLQALGRATVVGETTRGGANPGKEFRINEHFAAFVPTGRALNPVTGTNWEGTGVKPDIEVPEEQAPRAAHLAALRRLLEAATSERARTHLRSVIEEVEKQP
ncbi:MAG: S41 family peptidase [Acidobacteriota bacterium]|nr:S41 family peptidase [Acidobacteriota bacterium]